jgi:hypothetical protein
MLRQLKTITKSAFDIDRSRRDVGQVQPVMHKLLKVTAASAIGGYQYRWVYTVREATITVGSSTYVPGVSLNDPSFTALSVSELTNGTSATVGTYAYGVAKTNIPAGFAPKQIPVNTFVVGVPWWADDGTGIYLIINTQAIDGTC